MAVRWQDDQQRMARGLRRAEAFRIDLLEADDAGRNRAALIGAAMEDFRRRYATPLPERPTLDRFTVTADAFDSQLRAGTTLDADAAFAGFSGRWYGKWDELLVDHHWHDVQRPAAIVQPKLPGLPHIAALQYAWIGDGFGWNYLVRPPETDGDVVLGFVYHLKPHEPETIRSDFPLVGYLDGPGRLIWITPSNVYFEESFTVSGEQRYGITGFSYRIEGPRLIGEERGFQAVYTRNPHQRPEWKTFSVTLSVPRE